MIEIVPNVIEIGPKIYYIGDDVWYCMKGKTYINSINSDFGGTVDDDIAVKIFGGKAMSLKNLIAFGHNVPYAWVIPTKFSLKENRPTEPFDLSYIQAVCGKDATYAVRSGAPVSMPGLMHTSLNVPFDKLWEHVQQVWDSYYTDHAVAYRQEQGLDEDMGTAVTIQQMCPDQAYAGVVFTSNPNLPGNKTFNPIIEFVAGTGDSLVGGEVTPQKATISNCPFYGGLREKVEAIHKAFGPSDIEFCVTSGGKIYFVQQRALRYTSLSSIKTNVNLPIHVVGTSVGAPTIASGELMYAGTSCDYSDKIIYVSQFKPEYYIQMVKAKGIITQVGGSTCHASIIARQYGKPAISDIDPFPCLMYGMQITLDGSSGTVHTGAYTVDTQPKPVVIKKEKLADRVPDFRVIEGMNQRLEERYIVEKLLYRVYYMVNERNEGRVTEEELNKAVKEIAKLFCTYFYVACLCEMRWVWRHTDRAYKEPTNKIINLFRKYRYRLLRCPKRDGFIANRDRWTNAKIKQPFSITRARKMVELAIKGFDELSWSSSYGGHKWGRIAETLLLYLKGELNDLLFVDSCFNLEHNGGSAFGKFIWLYEKGHLRYQLDAKANGDIALVKEYSYIELEEMKFWEDKNSSIFNNDINYRPVVVYLHKLQREAKAIRNGTIIPIEKVKEQPTITAPAATVTVLSGGKPVLAVPANTVKLSLAKASESFAKALDEYLAANLGKFNGTTQTPEETEEKPKKVRNQLYYHDAPAIAATA